MTENVKVAVEPRQLPRELTALGIKQGYEPRPAKRVRLYLTGPYGSGKTTFISSIPNTLILDFQDGATGVPGCKANRVNLKGYDHYMQVTDYLITHPGLYDRIVIDPADEWVDILMLQLNKEKDVENITEFGSQGHGWFLIRSRGWNRLRELENAGYSWICVDHLREKTVNDPSSGKERTVLRPAIFQSMAYQLIGQAEIYATIYQVTETKQVMTTLTLPSGKTVETPKKGEVESTTTYYLDCQTTPGKEGKTRGVPHMKTKIEIPMVGGWAKFEEEYNKAIQIQIAEIENYK